MLGLFASVLIAAAQASQFTAPEARSPQPMPDYRLAASDGPSRAYLDIANIYRGNNGELEARVFFLVLTEGPLVIVADSRFDCAARRLSYHTMIGYDGAFRAINPSGTGPMAPAFERGSAADQTVAFVCGSAEARRQAQYLGADWKTATRMVDARFR